MGDCPALQQAAIAVQRNSLLAQAVIGQRPDLSAALSTTVLSKPAAPKQPRIKLAEIGIDDAAWVQRRWAQPGGQASMSRAHRT